MNLQEHIRKVLREESSIKNMLLRRVGYKLQDNFEYSLDTISNLFIEDYKRNPYSLSRTDFSDMVCYLMIEKLKLPEVIPPYIGLFDDVVKLFLELYGDEMSRKYNELKRY